MAPGSDGGPVRRRPMAPHRGRAHTLHTVWGPRGGPPDLPTNQRHSEGMANGPREWPHSPRHSTRRGLPGRVRHPLRDGTRPSSRSRALLPGGGRRATGRPQANCAFDRTSRNAVLTSRPVPIKLRVCQGAEDLYLHQVRGGEDQAHQYPMLELKALLAESNRKVCCFDKCSRLDGGQAR